MGREETEESRDWSTGGESVTWEPKDKRGNRRREKGRDSISQRKERAEREKHEVRGVRDRENGKTQIASKLNRPRLPPHQVSSGLLREPRTAHRRAPPRTHPPLWGDLTPFHQTPDFLRWKGRELSQDGMPK